MIQQGADPLCGCITVFSPTSGSGRLPLSMQKDKKGPCLCSLSADQMPNATCHTLCMNPLNFHDDPYGQLSCVDEQTRAQNDGW